MSVTVVLDTSAVLAYTKGSIAVGELLSIVTDDGDTVLVPASCLAEAHRESPPAVDALLQILSAVPCVALAPLRPDQAAEVGALARASSGIDVGHAAVEAIRNEAQLATQDGAAMSRLLPKDWSVIEV